jgi:hypothetical protein
MVAHALPSVASLEADDDARISAELGLARLREQVDYVRAITEHIDRFARPAEAENLTEQLIEEMARLGCRLCETTAFARLAKSDRQSGTFLRTSSCAAAAVINRAGGSPCARRR